jgi:hypothetical protein
MARIRRNISKYAALRADQRRDAEIVKREVRVIFGDYIKKEQLDKFPELPELAHKIYQLGSKSRQTADRQVANGLLARQPILLRSSGPQRYRGQAREGALQARRRDRLPRALNPRCSGVPMLLQIIKVLGAAWTRCIVTGILCWSQRSPALAGHPSGRCGGLSAS